MSFLMLVSVITMAELGEEDDWSVILSSCCVCFCQFFPLLAKLKEK